MPLKQKLTFANNLEESMRLYVFMYVFEVALWHKFRLLLFTKKDT